MLTIYTSPVARLKGDSIFAKYIRKTAAGHAQSIYAMMDNIVSIFGGHTVVRINHEVKSHFEVIFSHDGTADFVGFETACLHAGFKTSTFSLEEEEGGSLVGYVTRVVYPKNAKMAEFVIDQEEATALILASVAGKKASAEQQDGSADASSEELLAENQQLTSTAAIAAPTNAASAASQQGLNMTDQELAQQEQERQAAIKKMVDDIVADLIPKLDATYKPFVEAAKAATENVATLGLAAQHNTSEAAKSAADAELRAQEAEKAAKEAKEEAAAIAKKLAEDQVAHGVFKTQIDEKLAAMSGHGGLQLRNSGAFESAGNWLSSDAGTTTAWCVGGAAVIGLGYMLYKNYAGGDTTTA